MNLEVEPYSESLMRLPKSGQHLIAHQNEDSMVVYQAFNPTVANYAIEHQTFGGSAYNLNRMTWIKPNFLWMMYRCGWASKLNQERVLAIWISKTGFESILKQAVPSSYKADAFASHEEWKKALNESDVRLQWDPDHDPHGNKLDRRAVQLGLRRKALQSFLNEQIQNIEDITEFVLSQHQHVKAKRLKELMVPIERVLTASGV